MRLQVHDARVILDNFYFRATEGDLKAKVTDNERSALYRALLLVEQAEKVECKSGGSK